MEQVLHRLECWIYSRYNFKPPFPRDCSLPSPLIVRRLHNRCVGRLALNFAVFNLLQGKAWTSDYGDPHVAEDFDFIYPISPLHNIPDQVFPPTLLLTADRESLVYQERLFAKHTQMTIELFLFTHSSIQQHCSIS